MRNYGHIFLVLLQFGILVVIGKPQVPCYFIFGDSLVDSGNNNELDTLAKANYLPYGIDFPQGVTGRFTNGRTMADMIGEILGFDYFIPPYATATNQQLIQGVNYASGGAGIRNETGSHLGDRICLERQLCNHNTVVSRIYSLQRNKTFTNEYLGKCIYVMNIGSNDYINNYLRPTIYTTSSKYTPDKYATNLIQQYSKQLKKLYNLGGRKMVVFGLAKIGCAPAEVSMFGGTDGKRCVESINDVVNHFNDKLKALVNELNHDNHDAKFTFINVSHISRLQGAVPFANIPCCEVGDDGQCKHTTSTRPGRALSVYYDGFHPTEFANHILAVTSVVALSDMDASPYDISHLIRL